MKKGKLRLDRVTLQQLAPAAAANVRGGVNPSNSCMGCTITCTCPTWKHSWCDSCYDSDCCLMKP